jgi:hypothetical protein
MIQGHFREELLILVKTNPTPSQKYRETTCVAAINRSGQLRRLFPVPFRLMAGESRFHKWQWIDAQIVKAPKDHRPESYKIDPDTIKRGEVIPTRGDWKERMSWIESCVLGSYEELEARRLSEGHTLGIVRLSTLLGLDITPAREPEWTSKELVALQQEGLFDTDEQRQRAQLNKIPFEFHYRYACQTAEGVEERRHMLTDWEIGALYWNCVRSHGSNWQIPFRQKLEVELPGKDVLFVMGTMHRFPGQWLIIGLIYPPKVHISTQLHLDW